MGHIFFALALGAFALTANAASIKYQIDFDGSISGPSGAGTFYWDQSELRMSSFDWVFSGGLQGGITDAVLTDVFEPTGEILGAMLFEIITGTNVTAPTDSDDSLGIGEINGTYPSDYALFNGVDSHGNESRYLMNDADFISEGYYSVSLAPVPIPAAVWLFGSALGLLCWMRRKSN